MSDSEEETILRYGTPLDPIEEDEVPSKKKFQPEKTDQYAVDAHGKRRFHGAFTGGFSAGYGNTVATPEGFTPTSFKSSRVEKAIFSNRRPEDFMDDEDRSEFGIAPRHLQTQSDFSGQKRPHQKRYHDGPIPGEPVLEQVIRAVHETAAVRLLRRMGWRPGQGAGARVSAKQKRTDAARHKVYGCYVPEDLRPNKEPLAEDNESPSSDSEVEYETLFAPDDFEPYLLRVKSDRFGLGYSGLSRHSVLGALSGEYGSQPSSSRSHLVMKDKGKRVSIRGQAFGVGALEDDDDDIYAREDMSHYDFAIGGPQPDKQKIKVQAGSHVLQGFCKATKPMPSVPSYPAPALPRDYVAADAGRKATRFGPTPAQPRDQGLGRHELSAEARGALLGETPLPKQVEPTPNASTQTPNPLQTASAKQDDPIANLLGRNVNFVSTAEEKTKELDYIPISNSNKELTKVFKPFARNPQKQARYELYLKDRSGAALEKDGKADNLMQWERNREMVEFEQAAKLYKPLSGVMGDRFTHASEPDDQPTNPLCAVSRSSTNRGAATAAQIEAAASGLYGAMTRTSAEWRPEALLCKRFNVPDPYTTKPPQQKKDEKSKISYSIFEYLESSIHDKESFTKEQTKFSGSKSVANDATVKKVESGIKNVEVKNKNEKMETNLNPECSTSANKRMTVAELFMKEAEKDLTQNQSIEPEAVVETIKKFDRMELYKSIFLSDSESEDDSTKKEEVQNKEANYMDFVEVPKNVERNLSPPRGIFANIDFDELNSWNKIPDKNKPETHTTQSTKEATPKVVEESIDESSLYGPKIPENLQKRLQDSRIETEIGKPSFRSRKEREMDVVEIESSSSSESWVEAKEKTKKHKKKKSKKHKSKHKKSKQKKDK